jgi:hypothetical protein
MALSGGIVMEEAVDLSSDRLLMMMEQFSSHKTNRDTTTPKLQSQNHVVSLNIHVTFRLIQNHRYHHNPSFGVPADMYGTETHTGIWRGNPKKGRPHGKNKA